MPRPKLPLTPASSAEIVGKRETRLQMSLESGFALPPPALREKQGASISPSDATVAVGSTSTSTKSPRKPSTQSNSLKRRLSVAALSANGDGFELPPPPTRPRKMIHMEPRTKCKVTNDESLVALKSQEISKAAATESKRKQPTATSVAGRKIARKTAHSLIERRRRSKMNEEFGVLKDMIPACQGQEMHKLAILQASIDYLRYLEQCVIDVRKNYDVTEILSNTEKGQEKEDDDEDEDDEKETAVMSPTSNQNEDEDTANISTSVDTHQHYAAGAQSESPLCSPNNSIRDRYYSFSNGSSIISPTFRPPEPSSQHSQSSSGSPGMLPRSNSDREIDQEATEALLMLNSDRRSSNRGRALSVKDLLSN